METDGQMEPQGHRLCAGGLEGHVDGCRSDVESEDAVFGFCACLTDRCGRHAERVAFGRDKTLITWIGERFEYLRIVFCWKAVRCRHGDLHGIGIELASGYKAHMPLGRVRLVYYHFVGTNGMV